MKRIKRSHKQPIKQFFASALVAALAASSFAGEAFRLADMTIVRPDKFQGPSWDHGERSLRDFVRAVTEVVGKAPRVVKESEAPKDLKNALWYGQTEYAKKVFPGIDRYTSQEFSIRSEPGRVVFGARTQLAASFAQTEFLQRWCDYWYVSLSGNNFAPRNPDLVIPTGEVLNKKPPVQLRHIEHCVSGSQMPTKKAVWGDFFRNTRFSWDCCIEWDLRLGYSGGHDSHTSFAYCPPKEYFKDHPEYYAMHPNGERNWQPTGQLCMSNPDVYRVVFEHLKSFIARDRANRKPGECPKIFDFTQQDNTSWMCTCPDCRKIQEKYNRVPGGHYDGGDCGLQLEFVNRLARDIRKIYPDVVIRTFAYVSTETPPKPGTIVPEPNVMIWLCDLYGDSNHSYPLVSPRNRHRADLMREWKDLAKGNMELWDYELYGFAVPEIHVDAIAADAKLFREIGLKRLFLENHASATFLPPFWELNFFVEAQTTFDPDIDLEMLVHKYCRVYGAAAAKMEEAINFFREVIRRDMPRESTPDKLGKPHFRERLPYERHSERDMLAFSEKLKEAYALLPAGESRSHVAAALASTWRSLYDRYRHDLGPAADRRRIAAVNEYRKYLIDFAETAAWMEDARRKELVEEAKEIVDTPPLRFADLPAELKGVPETEIVCVGPSKLDAEDEAVRVKDAEAFCGKASVLRYGKRQAKEYGCGIYDRPSTEWTKFRIRPPEPNDEKYHWIHLGQAHIGSDSLFYLPEESWSVSMYLREYFVNSDGLVDNNWYDFWVSVKFAGPDYVPGSKKTNGVYVNRMVMRRTPKEQAR